MIYDLRSMDGYIQKRESSLKHQIRAMAIHPNCEQFVMSSIEGRVAVEYFDADDDAQRKKYAFKCHRITNKASKLQTIYPVNCLSFNRKFGTFATGGCDGVVNIWDGSNKKRFCQFAPYGTSVSSLDFNFDCTIMAVAVSYTWEQGPQPHGRDTVILRQLKPSDVKPKIKKSI